MKTVRIYALLDPGTGAVRYVGKTTTTLRRRVSQHMSAARCKRRLRLHRWLNKIGCRPRVILLEEVAAGVDWQSRECRWIRRFLLHRCQLCNATAGGEGLCGYVPTAEHREKIAASIRTGANFECEVCATQFWRKRHEIDAGNCRFCSRACYARWQVGKKKNFTSSEVGRAGRQAAAARRRAMTHCKRGHVLGGDNLYVHPTGSRVCKECRKMHKSDSRRRYAKA